jgi:ABC-type Fe3+/spermidine/putrescine transport system ATPase subunit
VSALEVRDLHVELGGAPILRGIDLKVSAGEAIALLGPSGSGKTTLLYALAGFVEPSGGEIRIAGREVSAAGRVVPPEQRAVGFVFQNYALWPHLDARETVAYPLRRAGASREEAGAEAERLLRLVGIGDLAGRRPSELSGGQQQRVGLARALARRARLYLLDEPTAHLDSALRAGLQEELAARMTTDGAAAIYATHDAAEALAVGSRVAVLGEGRIVQTGTPADIYERPAGLWTARLTGAAWQVPGWAVGAGSPVIVRPEWVGPGEGGLDATVEAVWYRGPHTDYRLVTPEGTLGMRRPGPPEWGSGDALRVQIRRWWAPGG